VDDLLRPSLQEHEPAQADAAKPWRVSSQVYVGFFGGALAVGLIAFLNTYRLRCPDRSRLLVVGATLAGCAATATMLVLGIERPSFQVGGVTAYGLVYLIQRRADRAFEIFDGDHESLVRPGIAAALAGWFLSLNVIVWAS
jgi:hypothetical protein